MPGSAQKPTPETANGLEMWTPPKERRGGTPKHDKVVAKARARATLRAIAVSELLAAGWNKAAIARELGCSVQTVRNDVARLLAQLRADDSQLQERLGLARRVAALALDQVADLERQAGSRFGRLPDGTEPQEPTRDPSATADP